MKIIGVVGSPRGEDSNTYKTIKSLLEVTEKSGAETEIIFLSDFDINPCIACGKCTVEGGCPIEDDVKEIQEKILCSDGVILGSPTYIFNVSSQMKMFIDRCLEWSHKMRLKGKCGASVSTEIGVGGSKRVAKYLNEVLASWGIFPVGKICQTVEVMDEFPEEEVSEKTVRLGGNLVSAIKKGKEFPMTEGRKGRLDALKKSIIRNNLKEDYEYWKEKGWIEDKSSEEQ